MYEGEHRMDFILWVLQNIADVPVHLFHAITSPGDWLGWGNREALARFIYYGASVEFFFTVMTVFTVLTVIGMFRNTFLWGGVRVLEGIGNIIGRGTAWFGLAMVIQQVIIVFTQRVFRVGEISIGPFGTAFTQDISWWAEELKLYNALIVCLCVSYTFIQNGHVRVDLFYAGVSHRAKKIIDMLGSMFFMLPAIVMTYLYGWFFMWRHLVLPGPSATSELDRMIMQARVMRWNVETIGFSPNGFNAYFLFKVLLVAFCILVFLQAWAFFWRSYLELVEGEEAQGKHLDRDKLGDEEAELAAEIH